MCLASGGTVHSLTGCCSAWDGVGLSIHTIRDHPNLPYQENIARKLGSVAPVPFNDTDHRLRQPFEYYNGKILVNLQMGCPQGGPDALELASDDEEDSQGQENGDAGSDEEIDDG